MSLGGLGWFVGSVAAARTLSETLGALGVLALGCEWPGVTDAVPVDTLGRLWPCAVDALAADVS